jgi:hypothetical protein
VPPVFWECCGSACARVWDSKPTDPEPRIRSGKAMTSTVAPVHLQSLPGHAGPETDGEILTEYASRLNFATDECH